MRFVLIILLSVLALQGNAQCLDTLQFPNLQPPCYSDFLPVCGCDGVTYQNSCYADYATVLQYSYGPCEHLVHRLYPNPAVDVLYVTIFTKFESDVNLYIFDRNGMTYYYQFLPSVTSEYLTVPVYDFEEGYYIVLLESNGETSLSKLIRWAEWP